MKSVTMRKESSHYGVENILMPVRQPMRGKLIEIRLSEFKNLD